ncbi:MAG: hypothetical protein ACHQTE_00815 [Candidatus Saccharimonadales bacterium]
MHKSELMKPAGEQSKELTIRTHLEWGATPLVTVGRPQTARMQARVFNELCRRTINSAPPDVSHLLQQYVLNSIMNRFHERALRNHESYFERLKQDDEDVKPEYSEMFERAKAGLATPEELLIVRDIYGMRSIELARLTHPYGQRIDQLERMRSAVAHGIERSAGIVYTSDEDMDVKYKLRTLSRDADAPEEILQEGFLMTRRRKFGLHGDDTFIHERSSFIVRTDAASGLNPDLISEMRHVNLSDEDTWMQDLSVAGKLDQVIPPLLASNNFKSIIPVSTTIYAYNKATGEEIERQKQERHANMPKAAYPELEKHIADLAIEKTNNSHSPLK